MTQEEEIQLIEGFNEKCLALIRSKGHDYSGTEDILKNFKQIHQICSILNVDFSKVESVHMFYIFIKIQRLCNLIFSDTTPKNESVEDTILDLRNYVDLLNCTIHEKEMQRLQASSPSRPIL